MDREKAATNVRKRSGASGAHAKAAAAKKRQQARHKNTAKGRSSRRTSGRADIAAVFARLPKKVLAAAAVLIVLIIVIVFAARGCGVSHKTPEKVVRTLVEAYTSGSESKAKKCYGVSKADDNLQQEMDAMWDGTANDSFNQNFQGDLQKFNALTNLMQEYVVAIKTAANNYISGEEEVKSIVTRK